MENLYLVSFGEIALKGSNRPFFERILLQRIRQALSPFPGARIQKTHGRIYCFVEGPRGDVISALQKVFGIVAISPAKSCDLDLEDIKNTALSVMGNLEYRDKTFKVETRRPNKSFPMKSPDISREVGAHILMNLRDIKVDVHKPDIPIEVEIRERAFVYSEKMPGLGGLPLGCNGKVALLMSGGIDSPVAGFMMMKRGVEIEPVYFHSFPYTSDRAKEKVIDLCKTLSMYSGKMRLHVVNFTKALVELNDEAPNELLTILMRRMMVRVSEEIAKKTRCKALVAGESLGQVASQTLEALVCTNDAATLPIFRPLIGFDKIDIMDLAKKIGTYETSIQPHADCCTVFVPEHPKTRPDLSTVLEAESLLDADMLLQKSLEDIEVIIIKA